jgi:DNA polymerase
MPWPGCSEHAEEFPSADPPARFRATLHPSAILRADNQEIAYDGFRADLAVVASALH